MRVSHQNDEKGRKSRELTGSSNTPMKAGVDNEGGSDDGEIAVIFGSPKRDNSKFSQRQARGRKR